MSPQDEKANCHSSILLPLPAFSLLICMTYGRSSLSGWLPFSFFPTSAITPPYWQVVHLSRTKTHRDILPLLNDYILGGKIKKEKSSFSAGHSNLPQFSHDLLFQLHLLLYSLCSGYAVVAIISEYILLSSTFWAKFKLVSQPTC